MPSRIRGTRLATIRDALRLVRPAGTVLLGSVVALEGVAALSLGLEVVLIGRAIADLEAGSLGSATVLGFGLVTAVRRVAAAASGELRWMVSERVEASVVQAVLKKSSTAAFEDFETSDFRDQMARALRAAQRDAWSVVYNLQLTFSGLLTAAGLFLVVVLQSALLILPLAAAMAVVGAVAVANGRVRYGLDHHDTERDRERRYLRAALSSQIEGKEVRLFGTAGRLLGRHAELYEERLDALRQVVAKRVLGAVATSASLAVAVILVLVLVAQMAEAGDIDLADAAVLAVAAQQLATRAGGLAANAGAIFQNALFLEDLRAFLGRPELDRGAGAAVPAGTLVFDRVGYTYPGATEPSVHDVSMVLRPGETVALVGANGSGKSTLAKLAAGLYRPTTGEIRLDGRTVTGPLTGSVGALFQDFARYEMTAADNVSLGRIEASDQIDLEHAARRARADTVIASLPSGWNTRLGRQFGGGVDLSLGQWQRIALTRAFHADAPIVVLDEPTSAMDPAFEADLVETFRQLAEGRAVLMITHRYSTVSAADRLVVLDGGRVVEEGAHRDLIEAKGIYAHLFNLQASWYRD